VLGAYAAACFGDTVLSALRDTPSRIGVNSVAQEVKRFLAGFPDPEGHRNAVGHDRHAATNQRGQALARHHRLPPATEARIARDRGRTHSHAQRS